ncbi:hypothetical protein [Metabacillus sp. B2-18]|uniref:hypothetical protein n=1 Tax=Metabacillus sp. B2-18 TaxID=2897333 RepID=UPI001E3DE000|nr:hypothetical protein [Metabacillus sp. B2-18]UGB33229.1 hypothetical protein LPC09_12750 [Metabacillus sp. B2-18]
MDIQQNDLFIITKDSIRYKSLYNQYIFLLDSSDYPNKKQALKRIESFLIYLTIYTNIRKINRIDTKHLILFARKQMKDCKSQTSEEILREVVKTLTTLKSIHKFKKDVSLMNYTFWCEVLK